MIWQASWLLDIPVGRSVDVLPVTLACMHGGGRATALLPCPCLRLAADAPCDPYGVRCRWQRQLHRRRFRLRRDAACPRAGAALYRGAWGRRSVYLAAANPASCNLSVYVDRKRSPLQDYSRLLLMNQQEAL
jgi:hypothetical protein